MKALLLIWREIVQPSRPNEAPYLRLLIALGHGVLGAALFELSALWGFGVGLARALIPLAYWLLKERADLRKGGSVVDSIFDALFVLSAAWLYLPIWHVMLIAGATVVAAIRYA